MSNGNTIPAYIPPDWHDTFTVAKAESELCGEEGNGFKFQGPGWYSHKDDVLLCIPNFVHEGMFNFYIWNAPKTHPREFFTVFLTGLPTFVFDGK